jgi:hypothetical protein
LWEGNHWRKPWPYGIDDATNDDTIMNLKAPAKPEPIPHVWYEFEPHTVDRGEDQF